MTRNETRCIQVGAVKIGGDAPVSVQTMCNTKTHDIDATVSQIRAMRSAGADIVRLAVPDERAALAIDKIKEQVDVPLVADIHFDYRLALLCAERGIDKIRLNPGNIGGPENVKAVADACRARHIPIRIGVNAGSLEKRLLEKYGHPCPEAMVESAKGHVDLLLQNNFEDIDGGGLPPGGRDLPVPPAPWGNGDGDRVQRNGPVRGRHRHAPDGGNRQYHPCLPHGGSRA